MKELKDKIENYKPLKEYSEKELLNFLDNNTNQDVGVLSAICSEVLRRYLRYGHIERSYLDE